MNGDCRTVRARFRMTVPMAATIPAVTRARDSKGLLALLAAGFILTGIPTVIVGPVLPLFISRWSLSDTQAGLFFSVQFTAALCGVWITTALTSRYGYRPSLVIGYVLTGAGLATLNAPTHVLALVATAAFGVGYGMVVPPTNLSAAEAGGASMVSLLNFAWGIGAVACSPLVLVALRHHFLTGFLWAVAAGALGLAACFIFVAFPAEANASSNQSGGAPAASPALAITIAVSALFFVYVGTETSIGGWAAEDTKRLAGHATNLTTMAPLFFYAGLMLGRGAAPLVLKRLGEFRVVLTAIAMDVLGIVLVIGANSAGVAFAGFAIAGLGCASIYPIYISWFSKWYGPGARRLGGVVFSMASLGASALPWLVGFISTRTGSLRIGLLVPLAGCFVMLGLLAALQRRGLEFTDSVAGRGS
jgi:FHS family glucose/mannose:H+ symporter-like MFS transporter